MTVEQEIIEWVIAELTAKVTAVSGNVFESIDEPLDPDLGQLPALVIDDIANEADEESRDKHFLYLDISALAAGSTSPKDVRQLKHDIINALRPIPKHVPGVLEARFLKSESLVEEQSHRLAGAVLSFAIEYRTGDNEYI